MFEMSEMPEMSEMSEISEVSARLNGQHPTCPVCNFEIHQLIKNPHVHLLLRSSFIWTNYQNDSLQFTFYKVYSVAETKR